MSTYSDSEMDRMDRAAEKQIAREDFARRHPEWTETNAWVGSIVMAPWGALARAEAKALGRRFSAEPESITGFGPLEADEREQTA